MHFLNDVANTPKYSVCVRVRAKKRERERKETEKVEGEGETGNSHCIFSIPSAVHLFS